jgi:serine/threonine protein kinase/tetratricopeptide (TPR) repeat protein
MAIEPGARLDGYEIVRPLGTGGMGEVWLATELRLRRKVALKLLPAELAQNRGRLLRFEQEARAASALNHPNVCTIYALGETPDGQLYIAMEYVEGKTLRDRLVARLTIREAIGIAIQVASALSAAHSVGIIHRDIKPENIMIRPDDLVKVLDFGLAKLTAASQSVGSESTNTAFETELGKVMGTVAYMSPEQARGQQLDARTDIWSLGVVLYEMVAGRAPFGGSNTTDTLVEILEREAPALTRYEPTASAELQRIVGKTLRKDREQRYQTIRDLTLDLQTLQHGDDSALPADKMSGEPAAAAPRALAFRLAGFPAPVRRVAVVLIICGLGLALVVATMSDPFGTRSASTRHAIRSLAVVPLENFSGDPEQEYFADGMTEALSIRLSALKGVRVISRTSVMQFKRTRKPVPEIAQALKVDAIVAGSVQRAGDRVRISVQLVRGDPDETLWSGAFDREMYNVLELQTEVAQTIAERINVTIAGPSGSQPTRSPAVDPNVYESYLKGLFELRKFTQASITTSIGHFERAIAQDATFAPAHLGLAEAYGGLGTLQIGVQPAYTVRPKATAAVRRALELDPSLARAHAVLADLRATDLHWGDAEAGYRRAIELNPSDPKAYEGLAWLLVCRGHSDEAIESSRRARELDPLSVDVGVNLGVTLLVARRYEEAIRELRNLLALHPQAVNVHGFLGLALLETGHQAEAIRLLERAVSLSHRNPWHLGMLANAYARGSRRPEARRIVDELQRLRKTQYVTPGAFVFAYAGLGDHAATLASLEEAYAERANIIMWINVTPTLDPLRSDPRFANLVRRVGLD